MGIKEVLMQRDELSAEDAEELLDEAKEVFDELLLEGDVSSAYKICQEYFGLEPDYLHEFFIRR